MSDKKIMLTIPEGIAVYPHLLQEDKYQLTEHGKREFNTQIRLDLDNNPTHAAFITQLDKLCNEAFEEGKSALAAKIADPEVKGKAKKAAKDTLEGLRLHTPYTAEVDDEGDDTGAVLVSTKCLAGGVYKRGPKEGEDWTKSLPMFDANQQPIAASAREGLSIWGGSKLIVATEVIPFCAEGLKLAGVSLRLQAVQVIEAKGGSGGSANDFGFGVVEGGYQTDNFANAAAPASTTTEDSSNAEEDDF
jgi:hypothetical protein